ncbi:unknown [Bacteroides intestinalis CAG:315]|nr:unknown [Bacteroides intestinalis CAG:315]
MFDFLFGSDRGSCRLGAIPAILCPFNWFDKRGTSQSVIPFCIRMIYNPPVTVYIVNQCTVSLRPPVIRCTVSMYHRIIRRIFPRPCDIFRTGGDHHVASCWTCCSSLGGSHVIVAVPIIQFGRFQTHTFRIPSFWVYPTLVYLFFFSDGAQSVICKLNHFSFVHI